MTIALEHQHAWCVEAGASLATTGSDHGVQWRIGPAPSITDRGVSYQPGVERTPIPAATHCPVCEAEFGSGQTVVRSSIVRGDTADQWTWRCVRCFDWSVASTEIQPGMKWGKPERSWPGYNRQPTVGAAAKALVKAAQSAPRFKVTKPETFTTDKSLQPLVAAVIVASGTTAQVVESAPVKVKAPKVSALEPVTVPDYDFEVTRSARVAAQREADKVFSSPIRPTYEGPSGSPATGALPDWAEEWLSGLVFEAKREYARLFLEHLLNGAPAPVAPVAEWADKARKRARRLAEKAVAA